MRQKRRIRFNFVYFSCATAASAALATFVYSYSLVAALMLGTFALLSFVLAGLSLGELCGVKLNFSDPHESLSPCLGKWLRVLAIAVPAPFIFVGVVSLMDLYGGPNFGCANLEAKVMSKAAERCLGSIKACDVVCDLMAYHRSRNDWKRVEKFAKRDLAIHHHMHHRTCLPGRLRSIGEALLKQGKVSSATRYFNKATEIEQDMVAQ